MKLIEIDTSNPKWESIVKLPEKGTEHADHRLDFPVNKELAVSIKNRGLIHQLTAVGTEDNMVVTVGKQRRKALPLAVAMRKKEGLPPLKFMVALREDIDPQETPQLQLEENAQRTESDPLTQALDIQSALDRGVTEEEVLRSSRLSPATFKTILHFLSSETSHKLRKALRDGRVSWSTYATLIKERDNLSEAALDNFLSKSDKKLSASKAKELARNGKAEPDMLGRKAIKELIVELKANEKLDKDYRAVLILAYESVLDARKVETLLTDVSAI